MVDMNGWRLLPISSHKTVCANSVQSAEDEHRLERWKINVADFAFAMLSAGQSWCYSRKKHVRITSETEDFMTVKGSSATSQKRKPNDDFRTIPEDRISASEQMSGSMTGGIITPEGSLGDNLTRNLGHEMSKSSFHTAAFMRSKKSNADRSERTGDFMTAEGPLGDNLARNLEHEMSESTFHTAAFMRSKKSIADRSERTGDFMTAEGPLGDNLARNLEHQMSESTFHTAAFMRPEKSFTDQSERTDDLMPTMKTVMQRSKLRLKGKTSRTTSYYTAGSGRTGKFTLLSPMGSRTDGAVSTISKQSLWSGRSSTGPDLVPRYELPSLQSSSTFHSARVSQKEGVTFADKKTDDLLSSASFRTAFPSQFAASVQSPTSVLPLKGVLRKSFQGQKPEHDDSL